MVSLVSVFESESGRERLAGLEGCFFVFQGENCRVNLGFCFRIFIVDKGRPDPGPGRFQFRAETGGSAVQVHVNRT